jgi:1-acyl-sn-glycerol-3-phosphate acyltransferase
MADAEVIRIDRGREPGEAKRERCKATTASGRPCKNYAIDDLGYCRVHSKEVSVPTSRAQVPAPTPNPLERLVGFVQERLRGNYFVDDFGYDEQLSRALLPLAAPLYEKYFRVRTRGISRIPKEGPAIIVANHSGTVALDAVMLQHAIATEHPNKRPLRNVGADLVFRLPFVGPLARKTGNVLACDEDALELLRRGELIGVFPEGYKGVGKGWRERYRLQRFGRGGFIELALRSKAPIIPVSIVGAEEAYPMIGELKIISRTFGLPYFPVTPTFPLLGPLGLIPLPSRWVIEFGDPIPMDDYPEDAVDDKMMVFDLADDVRDRIQQMLYRNLKFRGGAFF